MNKVHFCGEVMTFSHFRFPTNFGFSFSYLLSLLHLTIQDIEKEVRKEVDEAIAKAKVRIFFYVVFHSST